MQNHVAAVTMLRDDLFFLRAWLRHYGEELGRENCYIVNHGRSEEVADMASGCNIIGIPGDPHPRFDMKRWQLLNNLVAGLQGYYGKVIVGDVDELVVADPATGMGTLDYLAKLGGRKVFTPLGLEVVHRIDIEDAPVTDRILGPRRFARVSTHYSKPCVLGRGVKIARGGHYAGDETLRMPADLYAFHLKWCDFNTYVGVMDRRNAVTRDTGATVQEAAIGRHWFAEARGEDRAEFEAFAALETRQKLNLGWVRRRMQDSWAPRGETGFWNFEHFEVPLQFELPERFFGLF